MIAVFVVSAFLLAAGNCANYDTFIKNFNECAKEYNVDMAMFKANTIKDDCFYQCLKVKGKIMDKDGNLIAVAAYRAAFPDGEENVFKAYEACLATLKKTNACADAKYITVCMETKLG